jgi:hypothetical protein
MTTVERVYAEAMELSEQEQEQLVALLVNARAEADGVDPGIDPELEAELDEIEEQVASGAMRTYSLEEIRQRVRDKLDGLRRPLH